MDDEGFAAYVAARWPALVRSLVLLGCDPHEAEDVVQTALTRCYSGWDRVSRADDTDAYVTGLSSTPGRRAGAGAGGANGPPRSCPSAGTADASDQAMVRHDIERALGRLSHDHRTVLVLRFVADLSEHEVARVLKVPPGTVKSRDRSRPRPDRAGRPPGGAVMTDPRTDVLVALRDRVDVRPAPVDDVLRRGRNRRLRRHAAGLVAVVALVAGTATGAVLLRHDGDQVSPAKSVLDHAWWSDGTLHVGDLTVAMPGVLQLVEIPGGVVVGDAAGDVTEVRTDGSRKVIGHLKWGAGDSPGYRLLVDDSTDQVAWIDGEDTVQVMVVYDTVAGREVLRRRIETYSSDPVVLLAFEDGIVYDDQRMTGNQALHVNDGTVEHLGRGGSSYLFDAENGLWLTMVHGGVEYALVDGDETRWTVPSPGGNWQFSPDAAWLLTRWPQQPVHLEVWDVATGEQVPTGLPADAVVVASYPGDGGEITYAVGESSAGPFDLVRCAAASGECTTVIEDAADQLPVVLPEDLP